MKTAKELLSTPRYSLYTRIGLLPYIIRVNTYATKEELYTDIVHTYAWSKSNKHYPSMSDSARWNESYEKLIRLPISEIESDAINDYLFNHR